MSSHDRLAHLRGMKAVVIGDVMLDRYIWGDTRRISPEAPVPVIEVQRESYTAGGAANVALNLASIQIDVVVCGAFGSDAPGAMLTQLLAERGVLLPADCASADRPTIVKTRVMVQRQQHCRIDIENAPVAYGLEDPRSRECVLSAIQRAQFLILSDYAKGVLTQSLVDQVTEIAIRENKVIAWDPKPGNRLIPRGVTVLTPNRSEAYQLAGLPEPRLGEPFHVDEIGKIIFARYQPRYLVVTLGAEGMMLYRDADHKTHLPTMAREVFDVSGAGDTVIAVLAAGLAAGWELDEAATFANAAAGIVVGKLGTATASVEELAAALTPKEDFIHGIARKSA